MNQTVKYFFTGWKKLNLKTHDKCMRFAPMFLSKLLPNIFQQKSDQETVRSRIAGLLFSSHLLG